jgi:CRISPR-associated protein Csx10
MHVPGSVWRGAVARAWLDRYGTTDQAFREVFDHRLRFGPLLAAGTDLRPLSVWSCKYGPEHCDPWTWDAAFPPPADVPPSAGIRDGHWERGRGEVVTAPAATGPMRVITTTAIAHEKGSAAPNRLFSRDAVETGTVFTGHVIGDDETLDMLAKALVEVERIEVGGRSSVLGSAVITAAATSPDPVPTVGRVAVRTLSPTFLVDAAGRPSLDLVGALRAAGVQGTVTPAWTRPLVEGTGGFHAASRLPKPVDVGLAAGSTVAVDLAPGDAPALTQVIGHGLGLRQAEGFGWIRVDSVPWQPPRAHATGSATTESDFHQLGRQVRALALPPERLRWLASILREVLTDDNERTAVLERPGAQGLTDHQRAVISELLAEPFHRRRRLVDELAAKLTPREGT